MGERERETCGCDHFKEVIWLHWRALGRGFEGAWVRTGGGGVRFKGITAGVRTQRRAGFQGFLNTLL